MPNGSSELKLRYWYTLWFFRHQRICCGVQYIPNTALRVSFSSSFDWSLLPRLEKLVTKINTSVCKCVSDHGGLRLALMCPIGVDCVACIHTRSPNR